MNIKFISPVTKVNNTMQYNTIQYNTIQYNAIQHDTIQYNTIQYNTIQYNTIQYNTIQYNTIQNTTWYVKHSVSGNMKTLPAGVITSSTNVSLKGSKKQGAE